MGIHTAVLDKASANPFAEPRTPSAIKPVRAYAELAVRLSIACARVVALASVNKGEGVTRTVRGLAAEFARAGKDVVTLDPNHNPAPILGAPLQIARAANDPISIPEGSDIVLFDCGSLQNSMEVLRVAPLVDGIVLVVESDRTRKEQVQRFAQLIQEANGKLLGCVLNKRRYPVPEWLHRIL